MDINDDNFEQEVLKAKEPVLVDFYAEWCGPCKMAAPVIEELAREYQGKAKVVKLNVDNGRQTAARYGVMSIPTMVVFKNGQEVSRAVGFSGKAGCQELLNKVIE